MFPYTCYKLKIKRHSNSWALKLKGIQLKRYSIKEVFNYKGIQIEGHSNRMDIKQRIKERVNKREIYRYLGYRGQAPDESVALMVDSVLEELIKVINPKCLYKYYHIKIVDNRVLFFIDNKGDEASDRDVTLFDEELSDIKMVSNNLTYNLDRCSRTVILAATLGVEAEKLLYRYEVVNMAKASVAQACGAACIEAYCNIISDEILENNPGCFLRPRFSPGYGDLSLETQKDIFKNLECSKRLGLTLTDSLLMYPTKSVTAIIGLTNDETSCHTHRCRDCTKKDCEFRDEY